VAAFLGHGAESVVESAFHAKHVNAGDSVDKRLVESRVATIGILALFAARQGKIGVGDNSSVDKTQVLAIFDTDAVVVGHLVFVAHFGTEVEERRLFDNEESIGGHRMLERESVDVEIPLLKYGDRRLHIHLDDRERVAQIGARDIKEETYSLRSALRSKDREGLCAATEMECGQKARQTKEVVAVEVRDEYIFDRLELLVIATQLVLCTLATINKDVRATHVNQLSAAMAVVGGCRRPRT
jgi:hypothetical protein